MRPAFRTLTTFLLTIVIGGIAVGACLAALIPGTVEIATGHHYTAKQVGKLRALAQPTTIYWADGTPMGTLGLQVRDPIKSVNEVPKRVIDAVIATEDRTFWTNDGIDLGAVFRAFLTNVTSGKIEQGGSTITQQLVKNRLLTPKRDVNRKIKEIEDALRLNEKFSKQKILTEYLNTVYFGSGSYGIKAAASRYFLTCDDPCVYPRGKHLDELTIGEAALLAGLISNPEGNNPFTYPDRAIRRRADVLRGEVDAGYITQAQSDAANNEPLPTAPPPAEQRPRNFLVAEVQDRLLADVRLGNTAKERLDKVLKGGLKVYTTFDPTLQNEAVDATTHAKPSGFNGDWISSLVAIEPSTGAVKAMVGGTDFAVNQYNVATHPPGRQPGSTWKVITLAGRAPGRVLAERHRRRHRPVRGPQQVPRRSSRPAPGERGAPRGRQHVDLGGHRGLGELRVRPPLHQRGSGQSHRPRTPDGHRAADAAAPAQPLHRHHRGHAAGDGDGDGHHRQQRHAPQAVRGGQGGHPRRDRARRQHHRPPVTRSSAPRSPSASRTCCAGW